MDDKTVPIPSADTLQLMCPTCGARYSLPKYVEGQKYGCKRCSASLMFGKFALLAELGRGGFGVVYKAWQADLQRVVALKFLHAENDESGERFLREARIAANLNHPNITAIYEVGHAEGKLYIAMQFVDGMGANKATFSLRDAVMVMRDTALAVDYAHARDIIHRDIKPHNIMVTQERSGTSPSETSRRTFVMDFGLARSVSKGSTLTVEGQVMGTPAYMSPEQAEGKTCDVRSDVYSLGSTLYALVARRAPFEAQTPVQVLMQVTRGQFTPPSEVNKEVDRNLEAIILKAMALDPAQRYPTAARMAADLTNWLAGGVTDAGPTVHLNIPGKSAPAGTGSKRGLAVALGVLLVLAGAGGLAWTLLPRPKTETAGTGGRTDAKDPSKTGPPVVPPGGAPDPVPNNPVLPAAPAVLLFVKTDPSGAVVRIGNREWNTPVALTDRDLPAGPHELELSREGYKILKEKVVLKPGPSPFLLERKLEREARVVAFVVDSEPRGAKVFVNGGDTGGRTPHSLYRDELTGGFVQVELELDGFFPAKRSVDTAGGRQDIKIPLEAKTGAFTLRGAAARATVYLFSLPASVRNPRSLTGLWTENPDLLEQHLTQLDPADVPMAVSRLKELSGRGDAKLRERAARLAGTVPAAVQASPERQLSADGTGAARIEKAWIARRYRVFATSARTLDFLSDELEPRFRDEVPIRAEMVSLGILSAQAVRPSTGQFRVFQADGAALGQIAPGGAPLKVPSGTVTLKYQAPAGEALLREFVLSIKLDERFDLGGNLHQYSGEAFEKEGRTLEAARCFAKVLEEGTFPSSEQAERGRLPDRIRALYRLWVDAQVRQGRPAGGDPAEKLEQLRERAPAEVSTGAIALYAGEPSVKGGAAVLAALAEAKLKRPYESMEWIERALEVRADPAEALSQLASVHARHPGLTARYESALRAAELLRTKPLVTKPPEPKPVDPKPVEPKPAKAGFLGLKGEDAGGAGAKVAALAKDAPAQASGLQFGDVITDFGAAAVKSPSDLDAALSAHQEGDEVSLKILRAGAPQTVKVKLGAAPEGDPTWLRPETGGQVGLVQSYNKTLGLVFVKLDEGAQVASGQALEVFIDGQVVGELAVTQVTKSASKLYPFGSASCKPVRGQVDKGQVKKKM